MAVNFGSIAESILFGPKPLGGGSEYGRVSPTGVNPPLPQPRPQIAAAPQARGGGWGQSVVNYLQNNPNKILGMASQLIGQPTTSSALGGAFAAAAEGGAADSQLAARAQQRAMAARFLEERGMDPSLADTFPEVAQKLVEQDVLGQEYKMLTDPAERQAAGIPDSDTGLYKLNTRTGEVEGVGSARTNINLKGEGAYSQEEGKWLFGNVQKVYDDVTTAQNLLADYTQMAELLGNEDVYTGALSGGVQALKKVGSTLFGLDFEGVANAEVAKKLGSRMVGELKSMIPGPMSNADRTFLEEIPPNLSDSPEGIQLTLELQRVYAQGQLRKAQALEQIIAEEGTGQLTMAGLAKFKAWIEKNPVVTPDMVQVARQIAARNTVKRGPTAGSENAIRALDQKYGIRR